VINAGERLFDTPPVVAGAVGILFHFLRDLQERRQGDVVEAATRVVEAATRKNEILLEYSCLINLIAEVRFYSQRLSGRVSETEVGGLMRESLEGLMRESLEGLNTAETLTKTSLNKVRAFDPKDIATQREARQMLEELHGKSQELTVKLTGTLELLKRHEDELKEKAGVRQAPK
jgi:hypothetical protein